MKIKIVYFAYLLQDKWEEIVLEQLEQLYSLTELYEISDIYMSIVDVSEGSTELEKLNHLLLNKYPKIQLINIFYTNEYEYPGIKTVYELSTNNDDEYILYFHSKGVMSNSHDVRKTLFEYTIANYKDAITEFQENKDTDIVCLIPSGYGFAYFNFFWARSSYINKYCSKPQAASNNSTYERYSWELWLGNHYTNKKFINTYSPLMKRNYAYDNSNAGLIMSHLIHYKHNFFDIYNTSQITDFINKHKFPLQHFSTLENICLDKLSIETTDKKTIHSYLQIYENLFNNKRYNATNVLEIGIYKGSSIKLWRDYFYNADIYGVDINDISVINNKYILKDKNIKLFTNTDAYSYEFITQNFIDKNIKFDILIHDGSQTLISQISFLVKYIGLMAENGILIIESIQNINDIHILKSFVPFELEKYIEIYDFRSNKNTYDDVLFIINKNKTLE